MSSTLMLCSKEIDNMSLDELKAHLSRLRKEKTFWEKAKETFNEHKPNCNMVKESERMLKEINKAGRKAKKLVEQKQEEE